MLEKPLYNEPEPRQALKCESCGIIFDFEDDEDNWECIDMNGKCCDCFLNINC